MFSSSQITPAFRSKSFDNFDPSGKLPAVRVMYENAKEYADRFEAIRHNENNWLVFLGEPGCGKTHLSMAVANQLLAKGVNVLYFQHIEGMSEIMDSLGNNGDERIAAKLSQMKKVDLLLWDDLFKPTGGEPKPFERKVAFEVLNYRYLNLMPTIISSELLPNTLIAIDKAFGSRIIERGKGNMVAVQGIEANYRLK